MFLGYFFLVGELFSEMCLLGVHSKGTRDLRLSFPSSISLFRRFQDCLSHSSQRSGSLYSALVKRTTRFKQKIKTKAEVGGDTGRLWAQKVWILPIKEAYLKKHKTQNTTDPPAEFSSAPRGCYNKDIKTVPAPNTFLLNWLVG